MPDDSVTKLCRAIASGDAEAFARFYRERFEWMYARARAMTRRDESFCLDVVHDAMLKVIRSIRPFRAEAQLECWLHKVVRSCAMDLLRRETRRKSRERSAIRDRDTRAVEHALSRALIDEKIAWLRCELSNLNTDHASMIDLRHRMGLTLARIGGMFDLSTGAVDGRINRAIESIQLRAQEKFDD